MGHARLGHNTFLHVQDPGLELGLVRNFGNSPAKLLLLLVNMRVENSGIPVQSWLKYLLTAVCIGSGGRLGYIGVHLLVYMRARMCAGYHG